MLWLSQWLVNDWLLGNLFMKTPLMKFLVTSARIPSGIIIRENLHFVHFAWWKIIDSKVPRKKGLLVSSLEGIVYNYIKNVLWFDVSYHFKFQFQYIVSKTKPIASGAGAINATRSLDWRWEMARNLTAKSAWLERTTLQHQRSPPSVFVSVLRTA